MIEKFCLDCCAFMGVYICQNSSNCTLEIGAVCCMYIKYMSIKLFIKDLFSDLRIIKIRFY